jgi:hypothetical protein
MAASYSILESHRSVVTHAGTWGCARTVNFPSITQDRPETAAGRVVRFIEHSPHYSWQESICFSFHLYFCKKEQYMYIISLKKRNLLIKITKYCWYDSGIRNIQFTAKKSELHVTSCTWALGRAPSSPHFDLYSTIELKCGLIYWTLN